MSDAKSDLFAIMDAVPDGYDVVRTAILEGRINGLNPRIGGSRCSCIKGHLADYKGVECENLPGAARMALSMERSPIEIYLLKFAPGQTPKNFPPAKELLEWLEEWNNRGCDFEDDSEGVDF